MPDGLYGSRDAVISLHVCWTNLSIRFLLLVISAMRVALSSLCFSSGDKLFLGRKRHYPQASWWVFSPSWRSHRASTAYLFGNVSSMQTLKHMHSFLHQHHLDWHCFILHHSGLQAKLAKQEKGGERFIVYINSAVLERR